MKRLYSILLLAAGFSVAVATQPATAQTPSWRHQIVLNAGPQYPTGDMDDVYKTGVAFDAGYYHRTSYHFFVGIFGGYHQFKNEGGGLNLGLGGNADVDIIPLNLAFKYNFKLTGVQPYIGAEGGPFFLQADNGNSSTKFGLAPRLGLRIPIGRGIDIDLNLKYNVIFSDDSNFTYAGTNGGFAYIFDRANIETRYGR